MKILSKENHLKRKFRANPFLNKNGKISFGLKMKILMININ